MHEFPHHYLATASATTAGSVQISSAGLEVLETAAPAEFGGPGDRWSPETLLVGAVADCFILSFKAIATASKFEWSNLECEVEGVLDRVERVMQFTSFTVKATLDISGDVSEAQAQRLLEKAEQSCLITNSMKAESHLEATVRVAA